MRVDDVGDEIILILMLVFSSLSNSIINQRQSSMVLSVGCTGDGDLSAAQIGGAVKTRQIQYIWTGRFVEGTTTCSW